MSRWPEPYPALLDLMWRQLRGSDAGPSPPLPDLAPADAARPPADPFFTHAFLGFIGRYFTWRYITAAEMAQNVAALPAATPITAAASAPPPAPAPISTVPAAPPPAAAPTPAAIATATATAIASSESSSSAVVMAAETAAVAAAPSTPPESASASASESAPVAAPPSAPADPQTVLAMLKSAAEAVPKDARSAEFFEFVRVAESFAGEPASVVENPAFVRAAITVAEQVNRFAVVLPDLADAAKKFLDAIDHIPGVVSDTDNAEVEHVPSAARPGRQTRVLRRGYRSKDGSMVVKPRVQVSSRELSDPRAKLETFPLLADAIELFASQIEKQTYAFLRKLPEVVDSSAHGDPTGTEAVSILRDCVKWATEVSFFYALPECKTIIGGLDLAVDHMAEWLRENHLRVFPSVAQPFREGRPAPAPFPQTVLKEVPDPSPEGTLLRIQQRGFLKEGKVDLEPVVLISKGTRKGENLARGLSRMAVELRRLSQPFKPWYESIKRAEELLQKWIDAPDEKEESHMLRFLLNHLDELVADGPLREAANLLAKHLADAYNLRPLSARAGGRVDESFDPKEWELERKPGATEPSNTILHVRRRAFKDATTNLLVQKGKLLIA